MPQSPLQALARCRRICGVCPSPLAVPAIEWSTIHVNTQEIVPTVEQVEAAAATLKILGDPTRLRIVWALLHGSHAVNDLAAHVGAQPAAVSQHLAKLRLAQLVRTERDGNKIRYALVNDHIDRLATEALFHSQHLTGAEHSQPKKLATDSERIA